MSQQKAATAAGSNTGSSVSDAERFEIGSALRGLIIDRQHRLVMPDCLKDAGAFSAHDGRIPSKSLRLIEVVQCISKAMKSSPGSGAAAGLRSAPPD